jgi:hypothetical protein
VQGHILYDHLLASQLSMTGYVPCMIALPGVVDYYLVGLNMTAHK